MKKQLTINIGMISLINIFIILMLITFATLSLVSAKNNEASTKVSIEHTKQVIELQSQAQYQLAFIDTRLYEIYSHSQSEVDYFNKVNDITRNIEGSSYNNHILQFDVQNDTTKLTVELLITYPGQSFYEIETYVISPIKEWQSDLSMDVL